MKKEGQSFNPPPGWPPTPPNWRPPAGWAPPAEWPDPPPGWELWISTGIPDTDSSVPEKKSHDCEPAIGEESISGRDKTIAQLKSQNESLRRRLLSGMEESEDVIDLSDERILQSVGIYRYHHPLENALEYKPLLADLSSRMSDLIKSGNAILKSNLFTFENSLAKGRKIATDLSKLMLRAYNAEAENSVRALRLGNVQTAKKRLEASRAAIAKLGSMMEMSVSEEFHSLRVEEIELTADWLMKKQEEKEALREERARLREQRIVERELDVERAKLEKERTHLINAIEALSSTGKDGSELIAKLSGIEKSIEDNDYRKANIRAGYVYVISNRGAFGPGIVKIGLTRRLEPKDRIQELSGAAVPFPFDVHALFFSEDAVTLEAELHRHFSAFAVNRVNRRKEFFFATPQEVQAALKDKVAGLVLEFCEEVESTQYFQSKHYWPKEFE
jgi:hypothetical protein